MIIKHKDNSTHHSAISLQSAKTTLHISRYIDMKHNDNNIRRPPYHEKHKTDRGHSIIHHKSIKHNDNDTPSPKVNRYNKCSYKHKRLHIPLNKSTETTKYPLFTIIQGNTKNTILWMYYFLTYLTFCLILIGYYTVLCTIWKFWKKIGKFWNFMNLWNFAMFYTLDHIFKQESIQGRGTIKGRGIIQG